MDHQMEAWQWTIEDDRDTELIGCWWLLTMYDNIVLYRLFYKCWLTGDYDDLNGVWCCLAKELYASNPALSKVIQAQSHDLLVKSLEKDKRWRCMDHM